MDSTINKSLIHDCIFFDVSNSFDFEKVWTEFLNDKLERNLYLISNSLDNLKNTFFSHFKIINAAGGIVENSKQQLLCIFRLEKWDLPKGKVEKNETIEKAALREVEEETGLTGVELLNFKQVTYHIYQSPYHKNRMILKPTYWFFMLYTGNETPQPQQEELITEAVWIDRNNLDDIRNNTYASLKELFE